MNAKEAYENLINSFINEENVNTFEGRLKVFAEQICWEQRQLVADELKRYSEDLSIPNQYKINDLCMDAPMPEL